MNWYKKALSNDDPDPDDDMMSSIHEVLVPKTDMTGTKTCESFYDIMGERIQLWMITGGTPALAFADDYSFTERFPKVEAWGDKHWNMDTGRYDHQDPNNVKGPTYDVLPNGKWTLINYAQRNIPLKKLREERFKALPIYGKLISKGYQDKVSGVRVRFTTHIDKRDFDPVKVESRYYKGDPIELIARAKGWWGKYAEFINPVFLYNRDRYGNAHIEDLDQEDFDQMLVLLREGVATGAILEDGR